MGTLGVRMPDSLEHRVPASLPYLRIPEYIPQKGLVGFWPMFKRRGTLLDYSGEGNDGTINGATWTWSTVWSKPVLSFDGADDWVDIPNAAYNFAEGKPFSVVFRITPRATGRQEFLVFLNECSLQFQYDYGGDQYLCLTSYDGTNVTHTYSNYVLNLDTSYVGTLVSRGTGTVEWWVDGNQTNTGPIQSGWDYDRGWESGIGCFNCGSYFFDGTLDNIMVFQGRELSDTEVKNISEKIG